MFGELYLRPGPWMKDATRLLARS